MPQILETDIGEIELPDDFTPEQIQDFATNRLPTLRSGLSRGRVMDTLARIGRDTAEAGAGVIKGLARGFQMHRDAAVEQAIDEAGLAMTGSERQGWTAQAKETAKELADTREQRLAENPVYKFGEQTVQAAREVYPVNPKYENTIPSTLIRAGASTIPVIAAAPTGPIGMAATYAALSGQQGAEEAIESGHPDKADDAYLAFAGLGAISEAALGYPIALIRSIRAARRAGVTPQIFGQEFKRSLQVAKEAATGALREGAQEGTEQFGQNVIARELGYDPNRPLTQGVKEAALIGAAVGGMFGGAFGTAQVIDQSPRNVLARELQAGIDAPPNEALNRIFADIQARNAMNPELAQRTVVPAMLEAPPQFQGPPLPPTPEPPVSISPPSNEEAKLDTLVRKRRSPGKPPTKALKAPTKQLEPPTTPAEAPSAPPESAAQPVVVPESPVAGPAAQTSPRPTEVPSAVSQPIAKEVSLPAPPEARPQVVQEIRQPAEETKAAGQVTQANIAGVPPRRVKVGEVAIRPDLMQFKRMDDSSFGINTADVIEGKWDDLKAGNLLLWEPANPAAHGLAPREKYIVANGHHRLQFGKTQKVDAYNAQVIREVDGFTAQDARSLGAEINIADGKGTIYDQARFIRNEAATHGADAALARARQIGARGRKAATIAIEASDSLFGSFINEQITPDQAEIIARSAPRDEALQRVGVQQALRGKQGAELSNFIQAVKSESGPAATQIDLFGTDDTAIAQADAMAKKASARQRDLTEQIAAVQGAAKRPEQAAKLGVNVSDPEGILKRVTELKAERERWESWALHPDLVAQLRGVLAPALPEIMPETIPTLRQGERQGDLLSKQTEDFALVGEKGVDTARLAAEQAAAERAKAEAAELQRKQQTDLFGPKYSVTLNDAPATGVTSADIAAAFPASQGFAVKPVLVQFRNEARETVGFLVRLPNGQAILIDPSHDTIAFDPEKAAADWGITPDQIGVAVGKFTAGGATLDGISRTGLLDLLSTAGPDTLSHEKFHALFEMALTTEERASILGRYKTEEKAAEAFRRSEGFTRGFWDTMRRFIEWLGNLVRGDAFRGLRAPLSADFVSEPTGRTEGQYSLADVFRSKDSLERFIAKPTISPEEAASLRQQAGAQASLVPDPIADDIKALNPADPIEARMAGLLEFVVKLHGMAPALEIQRILADPNLSPDLKDAAISGVLRQIEHVRVKTTEIDDKLQEATKTLATRVKSLGKITEKHLVEERSKQVADNLIAGYRAYLTAQAANLPANKNVAAARRELLNRMHSVIHQEELLPDATMKALEAIAARIDELPVTEGPQAVIDAIRQKGILRGAVGEDTIKLLTAPQVGGLPPLLLQPATNDLLRSLAELQRNAATYAKQIEVVEQAFRGKAAEPTPVELRKWAETYRKFRNKQADAAKALAEHAKEFREADQDVQVYGRSKDILDRLQQDPQFQRQFEAAINRPGGEIFKDIFEADEKGERVYTSPLKRRDAEGNEYQNKFTVHLAPDKLADEQTVAEMQQFIFELNEYLKDPTLDPRERRTWTVRRDYIQRHGIAPAFAHKTPTLTFDTPYGTIKVNPYSWISVAFGGRARGPRTELEHMAFRAAREVNTTFRVADQALIGYRLSTNNKVFGDAATKVAIIDATKSHNLPVTRIPYWNEHILNPILASGQAAGQMRLKAGDYIPGTGIKVTRQDIEAAKLEKEFSKSIVQTTQGTAKGLPGMLVDNPILIEDAGGGKKVLRAALGTGPLTMARHYSWWGTQFATAWDAAKTLAAKRRLVTDGQHFQHAALGYVTTTNPEFSNTSPLLKVYETFAARAKEQEDHQVQSLDQLVDRLAEIAIQKQMFPTMTLAEVKEQVESILLSEIGQHVAAFQAQFEAEKHKGDVPQTVMQFASSASSFTMSRKQMLAPDPYYDYTLTTDSSRIGFVGAAYQQFQLKQITALEALQTSLNDRLTLLAPEIERLERSGLSPRKARATLQKQTSKELDRQRFPYRRLLDHKRVIDKILKDLNEQVIDIRDQNDSAALFALGRLSSTLSSSLLANPTALANNLFGGGIAAQHVVLRNLGRANIIRTPIKSTIATVQGMVTRILVSYPISTPIGKLARSDLSLVRKLARVIDVHVRNAIQQYAEAAAMGLAAPTDFRNKMRAAAGTEWRGLKGGLMTSGGHIENEPPPLIAAVPNWMESIPGIRHAFGLLRDMVPRFIDEAVNLGAIGLHRKEVFDSLKHHAQQAFAAREELAKRTGRKDVFDFTKEANLLTPQELGMPKPTGYRDSDSMRQMFEIVGGLDAFLLDYYNRWKAAPEAEKADVPLFPNPADEGAVLYDMQAHGNTPTPGFTPPSMAGVGQTGIIKKLIFMFQNYVLRHAAQNERLGDKDLRDPKYWREAYAMWGMIAALIIAALAGILAIETGVPATRLITGRAPSRVTLANVLNNPDAAMAARYAGMALANTVPYYGQVFSQMLGNPGYGSWWDVANIIPMAGLVKDTSIALNRMGQTGDAFYPTVDFLSRWFPPASPVLRLFPDIAGDIEGRNAVRALRVVGPSEGMELAGGGGATYTQTPATVETRRLLAAAYRGDAEGIRTAFEAAVRARAELGSPDPEKAVLQSLAAATPARKAFGRSITAEEEARLMARMTESQRYAHSASADAFNLINQTIGTSYRLTSAPPVRRSVTGGTRRRRSLFAGSRLPSIRRARSRRSPFSRSRSRQMTGRKKRRSPAKLSFSA